MSPREDEGNCKHEGRIILICPMFWIVEICLLTQQKRTATVRAASYCNLFSLSKEHFDRILENYPLMRRTLETIAAKRLHTLGKDPNLVTSRESLLDDINGIQRVFQVRPYHISIYKYFHDYWFGRAVNAFVCGV